MFTRITTVLLFFVSLSQASAQWHFGVFAGPNLNSVHLKNLPDNALLETKNVFHYFAGVNSEYDLSEKWRLGLDVQYAVRGSGYDVKGSTQAVQSFRRKNLDLIPKASFRLLPHTDLQLGVYYSFLVGEEAQLGGSDEWISPVVDIYSKTDAGLAPGLRFQFGRWSASASALIGLKDVSEIEFTDETGNNLPNSSERNRSFQLGIGYRIF